MNIFKIKRFIKFHYIYIYGKFTDGAYPVKFGNRSLILRITHTPIVRHSENNNNYYNNKRQPINIMFYYYIGFYWSDR